MPREITSAAELRELVAEPARAVVDKVVDRIDDVSRRFLETSPFFLLATTGADGSCDVSPRGDPPGSGLLVLDDRTIAVADRKGNRRLDSMLNILARPRIGMLFMVPGVGETLRLNGSARIVTDVPYLKRMAIQDRTPVLAIEVRVQELFLHCAKAFARSSLWDTSTWPDRATVPTAGQILRGQRDVDVAAEVIDAALAEDARVNQY